MAGHEFFEPADRKRPVADHTAAEPQAAEESRHSCDPAFKHGVVVGFDGSTSSERALAYAIGMAHRSGSGLIIVHVANRLPTTVWAGCEPPVFVDVPDHRTEVLGLELACAEYLAEVPGPRRARRRHLPRARRGGPGSTRRTRSSSAPPMASSDASSDPWRGGSPSGRSGPRSSSRSRPQPVGRCPSVTRCSPRRDAPWVPATPFVCRPNLLARRCVCALVKGIYRSPHNRICMKGARRGQRRLCGKYHHDRRPTRARHHPVGLRPRQLRSDRRCDGG
ncbi:hypothetical protein SALBM311S_08774 [Streptomyces alboniger]